MEITLNPRIQTLVTTRPFADAVRDAARRRQRTSRPAQRRRLEDSSSGGLYIYISSSSLSLSFAPSARGARLSFLSTHHVFDHRVLRFDFGLEVDRERSQARDLIYSFYDRLRMSARSTLYLKRAPAQRTLPCTDSIDVRFVLDSYLGRFQSDLDDP